MTTPNGLSPSRVADSIGTVLLAGVVVTFGVYLGVVYLAFTPSASWWGVWVACCLGMIVVALASGVIGIVHSVRGQVGFWIPLVGLVVSAVLYGVVLLLETTLSQTPVPAPGLPSGGRQAGVTVRTSSPSIPAKSSGLAV